MIYGTDYYPTGEELIYDGWGYQVIVGGSAKLGDNVSVLAELRYQDGFSTLEGPASTEDISTTGVLAGLKLAF